MPGLEFIAGLAFLLLIFLVWVLSKLKKFIGFGPQKIIYQDTGEVPVLFSEKHGLCGKPDYILKEKGYYIPVEVKSTDKLYDTHVAQLLTYCLLVEENFGKVPPCGLLKLQGREEKIAYDKETKNDLLKIISDMKEALKSNDVNRSHQNASRCRGCLVAENCDQRLV